MSNLNLLYQSLLAETDNDARDEYQVDPRVAMYATRDTEGEIEPFETLDQYAQPSVAQLISTITQDELDTLAIPQLDQPNWKKQKTTVIIDSAQRDWTLQPDAYSNIFGFNTQLEVNQVGGQTPFYFNNDVIPYSAWEMPTPIVGGPYVQQQANNKRRIIPGTVPPVIPPAPPGPPQYPSGGSLLNTEQYGLRANTYGWSLVTFNGQIVHSDTDPTASVASGYTIVYFPVYDPANSRGRLIGVDPALRINADIQETFSTQLQLSNVASIRLVRATLPVRKFDTFNPNIFTNVVTSGSGSATVLNSYTGNLLNTFHSEPYLLLSIGNLQGGYYGAGQVIQNAFAALVQKQRIPSDGNSTSYLAQFQDYFPWGDEAYNFDPPLSLLSNAQIGLSNSYGQPFSHLDDMVVPTILFGTQNNINGGSTLGIITFTVYHGSNVPSNPQVGTDPNTLLSVNDVRPGDELVFYPPAIAQITKDPSCTPALSNFFTTLGTHNVIVTSVTDTTIGIGGPLVSPYPTLQFGYSIQASIKYSNIVDSYAVLSNIIQLNAVLPSVGTFPYISMSVTNLDPSYTVTPTFTQPYLLPFMNRMMQTAYSFEVETLVPDTTDFGKIVAK